MKRGTTVGRFLKPLSDVESQAYLTNMLQVADVLEWILEQTGPAEIWQTSFSISEEFLRRLYFIERSHNVSRFNLVLDYKATNKTLKLWAFISQVAHNTFLSDNHSKILLVRAHSGQVVSVVTSQNLTRGNRHESAFVSTSTHIFDTLLAQVEDLIKYHSIPLNELFEQKLNQ